MVYVRFVLLALALGVSTAFAAAGPCPLPPSGVNYDSRAGWNEFVRWCENDVRGYVRTDDRGVQGCYDCYTRVGGGSVAAPVAMFVGVPVITGSLAALLKLAGEGSKDPNVTSDTEDATAGYGKAFAVGAGAGLGGVLVGYGVVKLYQTSKPAGLGFAGAFLGASASAFNQSLKNDKKTPEQKDRDDESGKTTEEYKNAALQGGAIGLAGGVITGLGIQKFSDLVKLPPAIRNNRFIRRTSVVSSPSLVSGTRIGVVIR